MPTQQTANTKPERCDDFVGVAVTREQAQNFRLAANAVAGGNKSAWIKRTLSAAAAEVLARRKIK